MTLRGTITKIWKDMEREQVKKQTAAEQAGGAAPAQHGGSRLLAGERSRDVEPGRGRQDAAGRGAGRAGHQQEEEEDEENEELDFFKEERTSNILPWFGLVKDLDAEKEEEEEEEDVDPLGIIRSKKPKKPAAPAAKEDKPKLTIFDEEVDPEEGLFGPVKDFSSSSSKKNSSAKENLKLFEDPDLGGTVKLGDSLLLPTACENKDYVLSTSLKEDTEELLRVEEDLEKLWRVSSKPKPRLPHKPASLKKPLITTKNNVSPAPPAKLKEDKIQTMDEVDILQYIQDNESISNQDMSLF
ncbi:HCLS1-binding protein 3 [Dermochelys coriacea]|uniref:HCLS1-binding protein 3 n=1 Tax=Dermochelys coriacea TaxID=27794 RepID=UPI0018E82FF2|nr:HCLS1-binding protein 3 [Dermochelys coriacea]